MFKKLYIWFKLFFLLAAISRENAAIAPILISRDGIILDGNTRVRAARQFNIKQIPAIRIDAEIEMVNVSDIENGY